MATVSFELLNGNQSDSYVFKGSQRINSIECVTSNLSKYRIFCMIKKEGEENAAKGLSLNVVAPADGATTMEDLRAVGCGAEAFGLQVCFNNGDEIFFTVEDQSGGPLAPAPESIKVMLEVSDL